MDRTTPPLGLVYQGKAISIDPISGVISFRAQGQRRTAQKWSQARKAIGEERGKPGKAKTLAQAGWWIEDGQARAGFLLGRGRFGQQLSVELLNGEARERIEDVELAWVEFSRHADIAYHQDMLRQRAQIRAEHEYRKSFALAPEAFTRQLELLEGQDTSLDWERGRNGSLICGPWMLSVLAHGSKGSTLVYHLRHRCGQLINFLKPAKAMEFAQTMSRQTQGLSCVVFDNTQSVREQLLNSKLVRAGARAKAGGKTWISAQASHGQTVFELTDQHSVLTGSRAEAWEAFSSMAWDQCEQATAPQLGKEWFDYSNTELREEWVGKLTSKDA